MRLGEGTFLSKSLLVCKHLYREKFEHEQYSGTDDILALVESGSFTVDDGTGETLAQTGDLVCFQEGRRYSRHVVTPVQLYLFRYPSGNNLFPSGKITLVDKARVMSTLRLLNTSDAEEFYNDFELKQALFGDLVTQYRLENPRGVQALSKSDPVISQAILEINQNLHRKLRLPELAEEYFLSYVQFSRRFKAAVGTTVQDYITDMRLRRAKSLLADTDMPLRQVAQSCGFANEYYFSNFFREHQAMPPSEFRQLAQSTEKL